MQSDRDKAKEVDKEPKTPKEDFKVVTKKKKLVPKQLIEISLNKDKADKFKKEVQHNCGVRTMYWNHTKNYSPFNKQEEENYVAEKVKKYRLSKFLSFFIEKNYHYSLLRRFIKEYTKESPFNPEDRYKAWLLMSGAISNRKKNPNYYECLSISCVGPSEHFKRIIEMDVRRTDEATRDPIHARQLTNVLVNFSKYALLTARRNSRIGYCQGLNFIASYFLKKLRDEQDVFWIICYIIEESMPKEYYTNMLSVLADMQIVQMIFQMKYPDLDKHFKKIGVGLEMVALPCFITIFTNCPTGLVDIIMDFFFLDGPTTLIKTIVLFFGYIRKNLLKLQDIGLMIKGINEKIKTELVEPAKFFADMNKMYLSKYLIDVLRNYYTEKERKKLNKNKKNTSVGLMECESDWPICLENIVMNNYYHKSPSFYLYRSSSILENFKPEHFPKKRKQIKKNIVDRASVRDASGMELHSPACNLFESEVQQADIKVSEKQLLIERTKHICKYGCDAAIEKREHERKKKQMMFKIDVASRKGTKKRDSSSLARLSSRNSQEISTINFFNPDEIKHKDRKRGSRDDISLDFSLREPLSVKVGLRRTLIVILALPKRGEIEGEISNTSKITKDEALEKVKAMNKAQNHLATSSISQGQTDKNRISDAKPSILSRINPLNLFRKKQPTEILRPLEINVNQNNESPEMSDDEDKDHKKNEVTIEIESDEDDDARHPERDIVRRITLLKMQFDKVGVEDDLDFGEMFKSLVVRNVNKFDLPDTYH